MPLSIALCMIAKNEERNLQTCLNSVRHLVTEVIVVDTGSSDATAQIAAENDARVIPFDFTRPDFAAARNHAISQATGTWILVLDADETLRPASAPAIEELIAKNENAGYYVVRNNYASGSETVTADHAVRLFPNREDYRYRGRVHETIDASILTSGGRLVRSAIQIDHKFVTDRETRWRKNHWYIEILKEEITADPTDDSRLDFLAAEYHQLEMFNEAAEIAERIVRARPHDPTAHLNAGIYHLVYQHNAERATIDFQQALKLRPGYQEAESFLQSIKNS